MADTTVSPEPRDIHPGRTATPLFMLFRTSLLLFALRPSSLLVSSMVSPPQPYFTLTFLGGAGLTGLTPILTQAGCSGKLHRAEVLYSKQSSEHLIDNDGKVREERGDEALRVPQPIDFARQAQGAKRGCCMSSDDAACTATTLHEQLLLRFLASLVAVANTVLT